MISSFGLRSEPVEASTLLAQIAMDEGWFSSVEQAEISAERWVVAFLRRLRAEYNERVTKSRPTRFAFNSSDDRFLQGSCFSGPSDADEIRSAKTRRADLDLYLEALLSIDPREFEAVCRGILALIGCQNPRLTPRSNDQGIDVFGEIIMQGRLGQIYHLGGPDRLLNSWVLGQAKQYAGVVSTPELREFIGSAELSKYGIFADGGKALSGFTAKPYDPLFLFFLTTGSLSKDAWLLASSTGIRVFDGELVAALLADNSVGCDGPNFSTTTFLGWVASHNS
jgi:restriction endonuclease Mrr